MNDDPIIQSDLSVSWRLILRNTLAMTIAELGDFDAERHEGEGLGAAGSAVRRTFSRFIVFSAVYEASGRLRSVSDPNRARMASTVLGQLCSSRRGARS